MPKGGGGVHGVYPLMSLATFFDEIAGNGQSGIPHFYFFEKKFADKLIKF